LKIGEELTGFGLKRADTDRALVQVAVLEFGVDGGERYR